MRKKKKMLRLNIVAVLVFCIISASVSSSITYFFLLHNPFKNLFQSTRVQKDVAYLERGSPLDKRELEQTPQGKLSQQIVYHGSRNKKQIALTFDAEMTDGMREAYTSGRVKSSYDKRIINILNQTHTKATLFLTGMWVQLYEDATKEFARNPLFELASHSYADTSYDGKCFGLKEITDTQDLEEIETTQKILRDITGMENKYFRFPGGCYSQKDLDIVIHQAGLQVIHWDVVGADGFNQNANLIAQNIIQNAQNGSIIVLHMNGEPTAPKTAEALPDVIAQLHEKGYEFVTVSELLAN